MLNFMSRTLWFVCLKLTVKTPVDWSPTDFFLLFLMLIFEQIKHESRHFYLGYLFITLYTT